MSISPRLDSNTNGPQLAFDKNYLFMNAELDEISLDVVTMQNIGTTAITYEWKKVHRGDYIEAKKSD